MEFKHFSVMLNETVDGLDIKDGGIYVDGTMGGGGHSYEILSRNNSISLIGIGFGSFLVSAGQQRARIQLYAGRTVGYAHEPRR